MTIAIEPVNISTDTWGDLVSKLNETIGVLANNAVTSGGTPSVGDAEIVGEFKSSSLRSDSTTTGTLTVTGPATANNLSVTVLTANSATFSTPISVASGGTGANTQAGARNALGIGNVAVTNFPAVPDGGVLNDSGQWVYFSTGNVSSVGVSVPTGFTVGNTSPITTSGTIAINYASGYRGYTTTEGNKLANIEALATKNQTDAYLLNRANHTGTIAISNITGLEAALNGKEPTIVPGNTTHYYRGDKQWATLNAGAVGLSNVANKSEAQMVASGAIADALTARYQVGVLNPRIQVAGTYTNSTSDGTGSNNSGLSVTNSTAVTWVTGNSNPSFAIYPNANNLVIALAGTENSKGNTNVLVEISNTGTIWTKANGILGGGGGSGVPPGTVEMFAGPIANIPDGWLYCNGSAQSRTTYAALFAAIGTTHGAGNGSTTFNIPNMEGVFARGFDNGRGYDSGRVLGSYQADQMPSHNHTGTTATAGDHSHTVTVNSGGSHSHNISIDSGGSHSHTATTNVTGDHSHTVTLYDGGASYGAGSLKAAIVSSGLNSTTTTNGAHSHTVTVSSSGSHTHTGTADSNGSHTHSTTVSTAAAHSHTFTTSNTGTGSEVRVKNVAFVYMIKT